MASLVLAGGLGPCRSWGDMHFVSGNSPWLDNVSRRGLLAHDHNAGRYSRLPGFLLIAWGILVFARAAAPRNRLWSKGANRRLLSEVATGEPLTALWRVEALLARSNGGAGPERKRVRTKTGGRSAAGAEGLI